MDPLVRPHSGQMRRSEEGGTSSAQPDAAAGETRYVGVRRRRWGKWVSEIRVPGTGDRLWLGSYSTPEAAAVAHDAAVFFLRGPACSRGLNFPDRVAGFAWSRLSPQSVQKVASEWGMAVDSGRVGRAPEAEQPTPDVVEVGGMEDAIWGEISVDDMEIYDM